MKNLKIIEIVICLLIGVIIPYPIDYYKNHLEEDSYFKNNKKVLCRGFVCKFFIAIFAFICINEVKIPNPINRLGTIFIGLNGISILEKVVKNSSKVSENIE